jgi:uncharacterized membrane protein
MLALMGYRALAGDSLLPAVDDGTLALTRSQLMDKNNLTLYVGSYSDAATAQQDFESLRDLEGADFVVEGAVVMSRDADGNVDVLEEGGEHVARGSVIGGGIGLVVGLFAPPLLAATAVGAGIGAVLGHFTRKHEEKQLGVELDDYLPRDSSAIAVVVDSDYLGHIEAALTKPDRKTSKAIDADDFDQLKEALLEFEGNGEDAVDS